MPAKRGTTILASAAWIAYALSWFLPVMPKSDLFGVEYGWKAFLLVLSVVLKPDQIDPFWGLCIAGVLANVPVLISPWVLHHHRPPLRFVVTLALAFILNLVWIGFITDTKLLVGYWLWVGSMGLLTVAAILRFRESRAGAPMEPAATPPSRVETGSTSTLASRFEAELPESRLETESREPHPTSAPPA